MDRTYPARPLIGVSAAIWQEDKVLLVKRAKEPLKGYWSLPGGLVHTGESLETAIKREIAEETGLSVELAGIADVAEIIRPDDDGKIAHHYIITVFAGRWRSGEAVAQDDAADICWRRSNDLSNLELTEGTDHIINKTSVFLSQI